MNKRKAFNRLVTMIAVVAILMSSTTISVWSTNTVSKAEGENEWFKSDDGRTLSAGVKGMYIDSNDKSKQFAYLYFGKYNNEPYKFRLLSTDSLGAAWSYAFGTVLEGDSIMHINTSFKFDDALLNGFKQLEQEAIQHVKTDEKRYWGYHRAETWVPSNFAYESDKPFFYLSDFGIDAKFFPISMGEAVRLYGKGTGNYLDHEYHYGYDTPPNGLFRGEKYSLRSALGRGIYPSDSGNMRVGMRADIKEIRKGWYPYAAPACVVDNNAVFFFQLESGELNKPKAEYKFSLKDKNLKVSGEKDVIVTGKSGPISFDVSVGEGSEGVSQVSVIMLDGEYKDDNLDKLNLKCHTKIADITAAGSGTGVFKIPYDYDNRWKVYLVAEKVNGKHETDFVGEPYEINLTIRSGFLATAFSSPSGIIIIAGTAVILIGVVFVLVLSRSKKKNTVKTNDTPEE